MDFWNKKLLMTSGVILVFFVIFIIFNNNNSENISIDDSDTQEITTQIIQKDSDGDGLKDWEEVLWKTDPNNIDTDNDGMNDNDEILANRDPLIKGEGNLNKIIFKEKEPTQTPQTELTQTDILAREIFTSYVALKQSGTLGTQEQEDLIQMIAYDKLSYEPEFNLITLNDLNIIEDSSTESLQRYALELNQVLSGIPELRDDNLILKEALDNNSPEILEEIKSNTIFYEELVDNLTKMRTPLVLQNKHLTLTNLLIKTTVNTEQLIKIFTDPLSALLGAKQYYETMEEILNISVKIGEFFKQNNINF
ncbi:MAG: hypothetical protein KAJ58_00410 [Candidatus Pacebacteria bacterium]|nr:hypothetical protein [Candidatus Paceibacterota bacterium]